MILCKLTSGTTLYCCDSKNKKVGNQGYELDGQFYKPSLLNQPKISFRGNNWIEPATVTLQIDREEAKNFTGEEITVEIWLWDERATSTKFKVFTGVGILGSYNSLSYEYKLRTNDYGLQDDLLTTAPDFKAVDSETTTYDEKRVYPMNFGYIKHLAPLALAATCVAGCGGTYHSDGKTTAMYDGGQEVNYSQSGDTATKTGPAAVYDITTDVDGTSASAGSASGNDDVIPVQAALTVDNTVIKETVSGINYIAYQTKDNKIQFALDEDGNSIFGGVVKVYNYDETRLTLIGGKILDASLSTRYPGGADIVENSLVYVYYWNGSAWVKGVSFGVPLKYQYSYNADKTILVSYYQDLTSTSTRYPAQSDFASNSGYKRIYEWQSTQWVQIGSSSYDYSDEYTRTSEFENFNDGGMGMSGTANGGLLGAIPSVGVQGEADNGIGVRGNSANYLGGLFNGGTGVGISVLGDGGHIKFDGSNPGLPSLSSLDRVLHWDQTTNKLQAWDGTTWHALW